MCGINGIVKFNSQVISEEEISLMMARQKHRGPDDEGFFIEENVGFGFVRLSILDLSKAGHQPMLSEDGSYVLVFNGEIYNYIELRETLSKDFIFKTKTDTEVLLNAFRLWGKECLSRLNGMFAFAIYDRVEKTVFAARDRFGVKPFYYFINDKQFVFASELATVFEYLKRSNVSLQTNNTMVFDYLAYNRTDHTEKTFVNQIRKLPHGHTLWLKNGNLDVYRWYNVSDQLIEGWGNPKEYYTLFESSVKLRLRSDVPVGLCLSGGLDSSSISSTLIKGFGKRDLFAYSAVYGQGQLGDEREYIQEYESDLTNLNYVYPTQNSLIDDYSSFLNCHFEPASSLSIYSQFKIMKEASKNVRVIMDGQGADEQLAGYTDFFASFFIELLKSGQLLRFSNELLSYYRNHTSMKPLLSMIYYLAPNFIKQAALKHKSEIINPAFYEVQIKESKLNEVLYSPRFLQESLIQHFENKLEHLLKWIDLSSMYHSIEARNPFLDYRLVERTLATSSNMLIHNGNTKWILREAMKGILPEKIRTRQNKIGFENPADSWLRHPFFQELTNDALKNLKESGTEYYQLKRCAKNIDMHMKGEINIAKDIWKLLHVDAFVKKF
jgi:asparagine synthase (glutamine-hydrolysing)